ncbi:MAG TPA: FKBP-type peptidyl-prolyl cis-trans isomerase, partial [Gemmatimonadales bacterium]|nr:FKBP-type peptidyl-prolyl cis-trans isomerase [Gemmatimonadales bacterium]
MRRLLLGVSLLVLPAACKPGQNAALQGCQSMSSTANIPVTPAVDSNALIRTASGLGYQDLLVGQGAEAVPGSHVFVHYTGWLTNGFKFDSSRDRGELFDFALGQGQVIAGWDEGVAGMKVGGRRKLVIPPALGY